jgi:hypothetical protein
LVAFLTMAGMIGWLAVVIRQLRLANTKGKVLSRNGYVTRDEIAFDGCVAFYWIALVWGTGMLIGMIIFAIKGISN